VLFWLIIQVCIHVNIVIITIKFVNQATALLLILSKLNSHVFLRQVARYLHHPEDAPLWLKLIIEINTTDSLAVLTALYSFTL